MRIVLFTWLVFFNFTLVGQSKKETKANELIQQASLSESSMDYETALKLYQKAVKINPELVVGWYKYGQTLGKLGKNTTAQKSAFLKVLSIDSTSKYGLNACSALSHYYENAGKFDSAYMYFQKYYQHQELPLKRKERLVKKKKQLHYASQLYHHPININPIKLPPPINSENTLQYFPILTGDVRQMLFTRRLKGSQNEDIYIAKFENGWKNPQKLPSAINSAEAEGTATMSADGNTIICSYCGNARENYGGCDLYISNYDGKSWSALKNLGNIINSDNYESQPSLSADGRTLYFVSDRPGGIGGLDIYYSKQDKNGNWEKPINMGIQVNTSENEGSPFIHPNGISLFFASKGHLGMGAYDLFLIEYEDGNWQEAKNLGYPINDQNNQVSLYVSPDGSKGYYSKEEYQLGKPVANQSNIWTFDVPPELKLGHRSNYVKGTVYNNLTKEPISAQLRLINLETGELKGLFRSGVLDGKYLVVLNEGSEYAFYAETPGYLFKSVRFDYSEKNHIEPLEMDIYLDPIIKGVTVQLNNIYFETGKAILLPKSKIELHKLYELMKQNPSLKIELGGHTDNTGSEKSNLILSQKRVDAVKSYLVSAGIDSNRIVGKGYGESKPVDSNETIAGRKKNRRVEFTVL